MAILDSKVLTLEIILSSDRIENQTPTVLAKINPNRSQVG